MIELCHHDHNYLAICQHYRAIFDTPQVQGDEDRWKAVELRKNVVSLRLTNSVATCRH